MALQDAIVPIVMPFVTENIGKKSTPEDWHLREAATFAFGSILEGPSPASLAEIVRQAMGFLLAVSSVPCTGARHLHPCMPFVSYKHVRKAPSILGTCGLCPCTTNNGH